MKLNYKRTFLVGFAFFLICTFWQAYDTIIPKILTDKFGLDQTASGFVMAIDNILALFMLPLFGTLSDKCKSKLGRRTPFILVGTIVACVAFVCMSFADNAQLNKIKDVAPDAPNAQVVLYEADLEIKNPEGNKIKICEKFSQEEFAKIAMKDSEGEVTADYTNYVVPARQAFAEKTTKENPSNLIVFMSLLLITLLSMATFRSPAVALMPDVTIKPLRSKANAIINLMGAVGGIIVLILGIVFGTGKSENAVMSYTTFFAVIAGIMIVSLIIFKLTVNEPKLVEKMQADSKALGLETEYSEDEEEKAKSGDKKLSKKELASLFLILASVVFWFMGYNAVTSKYSVYASTVLNLDYNTTLTIASAAAIVAYIPVGFISSRFGRKKTIMAGIIILGTSFLMAAFMRSGSSMILMNILFAMAGIGWATINVNSYPMVVELSKGSDVGKYTGFYYTASMAAQTVTPIVSGFFMDIKMTSLFVYATIFVFLAFFTMMFVKHGDTVISKGKK
ncbi:MAG: MFS transporter [Clostridia bacterium]|nr:MFS transporter [Clostridia bacterium]